MDDAQIRLKCLEIASAEHPGTRLMRAEELYKWVKNAPPAADSGASGSHTGLSDAELVKAMSTPAPFKVTPEQAARLDPEELDRMSES